MRDEPANHADAAPPVASPNITAKLVVISQLTPVTVGTWTPPPLAHAAPAAASTSPMLKNAPRPPRFWIHFPTDRPRMLASAISASQPNDTPATKTFWLTST